MEVDVHLQETVGIKLKKINGADVITFVWHNNEFWKLMDISVTVNEF